MTLNIELLRDAVEWAEAEAKKKSGKWDQNRWAVGPLAKRRLRDSEGILRPVIKVTCGSSFCLAGNICASEGDRLVVSGWRAIDGEVMADYAIPKGSREVKSIRERACELLGVDSVDVEDDDGVHGFHDLFDGDNTIEDVRRIAELLAAEHGFKL